MVYKERTQLKSGIIPDYSDASDRRAHHYVVNSGPDWNHETNRLLLSESWCYAPVSGHGVRQGINCFVFIIQGYFMYRSVITGQKLLKLYLQIALYGLVIYTIFCITGHDSIFSVENALDCLACQINRRWICKLFHSLICLSRSCFILG